LRPGVELRPQHTDLICKAYKSDFENQIYVLSHYVSYLPTSNLKLLGTFLLPAGFFIPGVFPGTSQSCPRYLVLPHTIVPPVLRGARSYKEFLGTPYKEFLTIVPKELPYKVVPDWVQYYCTQEIFNA
jgi:hypothetical protein